MKFELQVRRRMTKPGSKALKHVEAYVEHLKPGEGAILSTGHIAIHHPDQGLLLLRADHVAVYTPVKEADDPLASILGKSPAEGPVPVVLDPDDPATSAEPDYEDDEEAEMERQADIRRCAADLMLVERAREWLLGENEE